MLDLFGLRKAMESTADKGEEGGNSPPQLAQPPAGGLRGTGASRRKHLWAVLLILDTVLIFVFGGALAGMLFVRWATPTALRPEPRRAEPKRAAPKRPAEPAKAESGSRAGPSPQPAANREVRSAAGTPKRPVGRPGVSAPDLPRRESAPVETANEKSVPPDSRPPVGGARERGARVKAVPVDFQCPAPEAKEVLLRGPFLVRTGGVKPMVKGDDGIWRADIALLPGSYRYWCVADGNRSEARTIDVR